MLARRIDSVSRMLKVRGAMLPPRRQFEQADLMQRLVCRGQVRPHSSKWPSQGPPWHAGLHI